MSPRAAGRILVGLVLIAALAGCGPKAATSSASAPSPDAPAAPSMTDSLLAGPSDSTTGADTSGLIPAQHPQCDAGAEILNYLVTGDNGGNPTLDQEFANYVGVPAPQARALADKWIEWCDQQAAAQEASASSSSAEVVAEAAASASKANDKAWCEAHGGRFKDTGLTTLCESTVHGNPSGDLGSDCEAAYFWPPFTEKALAEVKADHPGCFP